MHAQGRAGHAGSRRAVQHGLAGRGCARVDAGMCGGGRVRAQVGRHSTHGRGMGGQGWRGGVQQGRHSQHHTAHGTEQGQRKGSVRAARMNGVHGNRPCGGWGGRGTVRPAGARDRACAHGAMEVGRRDAVQAGRRDRKCGGMSVGGSRRHRWGDGCGACVRMDAGHINNDAGQAQVQCMGIPSGVCRNRTDWAQADGGRVVLAREGGACTVQWPCTHAAWIQAVHARQEHENRGSACPVCA